MSIQFLRSRIALLSFCFILSHLQANSQGEGEIIVIASSDDNRWPHLSCDGGAVVWEENFQIYLSTCDTTIWISSGSSTNKFPQISCDGTTVVWNGKDQNNYPQIYRYRCGNTSAITCGPNFKVAPEVSCDGGAVVWSANDDAGNYQAYLYKNGVITVLSEGHTFIRQPKISCDGSTVMWIGPDNIFLNENGVTTIASPLGSRRALPELSGNGKSILWSHMVEEFTYGAFHYNDGIISTLEDPMGIVYPQKLSFNGQTAVWSTFDENFIRQIFLLENNTISAIPTESIENDNPQISCDGKSVVWTGLDKDSVFQVYLYDDGITTRISSGSKRKGRPNISCDGKSVVWVAHPDGDLNYGQIHRYRHQSFDNGVLDCEICSEPVQSVRCNPENLTVECSSSSNQEIIEAWNEANISALESCGMIDCDSSTTASLVTSDYDHSDYDEACGNAGSISVLYSIVNGGESFSIEAFVNVEDTSTPIVTCDPDDSIEECDDAANQSFVDAWNAANLAKLQGCSGDDCSQNDIVVSSDYDFTNFVISCGSNGSITVTYTIADDCGNFISKQATFSTSDTTPPVVACAPDDLIMDCTADDNLITIAIGWNAENMAKLEACSSDHCSQQIVVRSDFNQAEINCNEDLTVGYTITDDCGNITELRAIMESKDHDDDENFIDLSLQKEVIGDGPFSPGDTVSFTIKITNDGTVNAGNIRFIDHPEAGLIYSSHQIDNGAMTSSDPISFDVQNALPGDSEVITIEFIIDENFTGDMLKNIAEITDLNGQDVDSQPNNDDGDQSEDDEDFARIFVESGHNGSCDLVDLDIACEDLDDQTIITNWIEENNRIALACACDEATGVLNDFDLGEAYNLGALVSFEVQGCSNNNIFEATISHPSLFVSDLIACFPEDYIQVYECDDGDFENLAITWDDSNISLLQDCYSNFNTASSKTEINVTSNFEISNLTNVDCGKNVTITVTYTITDVCGYTEQSDATFSTIDSTPPIHCDIETLDITCITGDDLTDEIAAWNETNLAILEGCSSDGCSNAVSITSNYDPTSFICDGNGLVITYKILDECGNYTDVVGDVIVTNEEPGCRAVGGVFITIESDTTEVTVCVGDDISDGVYAKVWEEEGDVSTYIITDVDGNILRIEDGPRFEFEGTEVGTNYIYHVSTEGDVIGIDEGTNISDILGCFELSNAIKVNKVDDNDQCGCAMTVSLGKPTAICEGESITLTAEVMNSNVCEIICSELNGGILAEWDMDACHSVTNDVDNIDFSELAPSYPDLEDCVNVTATHLNVEGGTHSCTVPKEGFEGRAMCFSSSKKCYWKDGSPEALKFSVTLTPENTSTITGLQFYESAPERFTWYNPDFSEDIDEGPNNYPRFYGLRVTKNGEEIFQEHDIPTSNNWTLEEFDFSDSTAFKVEESTTFVFELLAYCPAWRNAITYAWDLDNIKLFGGCCDKDTTITAVDYQWSTGETTQTITVNPTEDTEYSVTVSDCLACVATKTLPLQVGKPIRVDLGEDIIVCIDDLPLTLSHTTDGIKTTHPRVEWSTGEEGESIHVSESGTYIVTVTDGIACSDIDEINVTTTDPDPVELVEIDPICEGSTLNLSTLEPSGQTGGDWTDSDEDVVTEVGAGTYTYTFIDNNGCSVSDQIIIAEDNFSISIEDQGPICVDESFDYSTIVPDEVVGDTWEVVDLGDGNYRFTGQNAIGCSAYAEFRITVDDFSISLGEAPILCEGEEYMLSAQEPAEYTGGVWTDVEGNVVEKATPGMFTYTVSNDNGCSASDKITFESSGFVLMQIADDSVCWGDSIMLSSLEFPAQSGGYWKDLNNEVVTYGMQDTRYRYHYFNVEHGCAGIVDLKIHEMYCEDPCDKFSISFISPEAICNDDTYKLASLVPDEAIGGEWKDGDGNIVTEVGPGTYSYSISNDAGCTASADVTIVGEDCIDPCEDFTVSVNSPDALCDDETISLNSLEQVGSSGGTWTNIDGEEVSTVGVGGYTYAYTNTDGCSATYQIEIALKECIDPCETFNISFINPEAICDDATFDLTTLVSSAAAGGEWINADDTVVSIVGPGTYTYSVTNEAGCSASADVTIVGEDCSDPCDGVNIDIPNPGAICTDSILNLMSIVPSELAGGIWIDIDGNEVADVPYGIYTYTLTNSDDCEVSTTITIEGEDCSDPCNDFAISLLNPDPICDDETVDLNSLVPNEFLGGVWTNSSGEVTEETIEEGLLLYYPFSGDGLDASENQYNATISADLTSDRFGNPNQAYSFNGIDNYIDLPNMEGLKPKLPVSFSFWVKYDSDDFEDRVLFNTSLEENVSSGVFFTSQASTGKFAVGFGDGSNSYSASTRRSYVSNNNITTNQWHYVAVVVNSEEDMKIYVDCEDSGGSYSGTGGPLKYSNSSGSVGRHDQNLGNVLSYYFKGSLDDFRYWDRSISEEEVRYLNNRCSDVGPGVYSYTVTSNDGCTTSAEVTISVKDCSDPCDNHVPSISIDDVTICESDAPYVYIPSLTCSETISYSTAGAQIDFSTTFDSLFVFTSGTVDVVVTGPNGDTSIESFVVTVEDCSDPCEGFSVTIPDPDPICDDSRFDLNDLVTDNISGGIWANSSGQELGAASSDGLLLYYPFSGDASDASGNNYDADVKASLTTDRFGNAEQAYSFNGVDEYIDFPNVQDLKPELPMSFSFWVKFDDISPQNGVIFTTDFVDNNYTGAWMNISSTGLIAINYGDGSGSTSPNARRSKVGSTNLIADNWYHVVGVIKDAEDMDLYINCIDEGGTYSGIGSDLEYSSSPGSLGRSDADIHGPPYYFKGSIDEFRYWNKDLTPDEVSSLCESSNAITPGVYTYTLTNNDGCTASTEVTIEGTDCIDPCEDHVPSITIEDITICASDAPYVYIPNLTCEEIISYSSGNSDNISFNGDTLFVSGSASINVDLTGRNGERVEETFLVIIENCPPPDPCKDFVASIPDLGVDRAVCESEFPILIQLDTSECIKGVVLGKVGDAEILDDDRTISINGAADISVQLIDVNDNTTETATLNITVQDCSDLCEDFTISLADPEPICADKTIDLNSIITDNISGGEWTNSSGHSTGNSINDGLLLYYPFSGDGSDASGNNFNADVNASLTADRFGNPDQAYSFNGIDEYIDFPNVQELKPELPISFVFWVKFDSLAAQKGVIFTTDFVDNNYTGAWMRITTSGLMSINYGDGSGSTSPNARRTKLGTTNLTVDNWYHVAGVIRDAEDMDIYINCINDGGTYSGVGEDLEYSSSPGSFGRTDADIHGPPYYFDGSIDEFRYWNKDLTQDEVSTLCESTDLVGPGVYTYTVTNNDGCTASTDITIEEKNCDSFVIVDSEDEISIDEDEEPDLTLQADVKTYPNPTSDHLSILVSKPNDIDKVTLEFFNIEGNRLPYNYSAVNELGNQVEYTISVKDFRGGVYILRTKVGRHTINKRVIVIK